MSSTCNCDHCKKSQSGGQFMSGMALGMILGGVVSFLYASPDGKEKAKKFIEDSSDVLKELSEKAQDMTSTIEKQVRKVHKKEAPISFVSSFRKRFFKQNGEKLN